MCIDMDMLWLAAVASGLNVRQAVSPCAEFHHRVVYYATDQC